MPNKVKLVVTIVSIVCAICVMALGIYAVLLSFEDGVTNTAKLTMVQVDGTLYCSRYGAGRSDYRNELFYDKENGVYQQTVDKVLEDTDFANYSSTIEYVFYFERDQISESDTWINLENVSISDPTYLSATYKYAYSETEPDWESASPITGTIIASREHPYVWVRACLSVKEYLAEETAVIHNVVWNFELGFYGNMQTKQTIKGQVGTTCFGFKGCRNLLGVYKTKNKRRNL